RQCTLHNGDGSSASAVVAVRLNCTLFAISLGSTRPRRVGFSVAPEHACVLFCAETGCCLRKPPKKYRFQKVRDREDALPHAPETSAIQSAALRGIANVAHRWAVDLSLLWYETLQKNNVRKLCNRGRTFIASPRN